MASTDHVERVFLGGQGPALHAAANWLMDSLGGGSADLGGELVVVPGARAQRRLLELLAEQAEGSALIPPTVVTLGGLADRLMPVEQTPIASKLASVLAWSSVLREAEPDLIAEVMPHPPARDDWPGWWSLAEQVIEAADELGAQCTQIDAVPERIVYDGDEARWRALAALSVRYRALLAERGLADRHAARLEAIDAGACGYSGRVVLLATADLQPVQTAMLACVEAPVHALIAAGEADAEGFDAFGGLVAAYWADRAIEIDEDTIVFVDRPGDQAAAVMQAVAAWSVGGDLCADDVTVGLGDESLAGPIARTLGFAGLPVRSAAGRALAGSRPVMLMRALGEFANGMRFDKLAALLRHPDAELAVTQLSGQTPRPWLTLLDKYATSHLAARPAGGWLGGPAQVDAMQAVHHAAVSLLPDPPGRLMALSAWAEPMGDALLTVYGARRLNRHADEDRSVVAALEAIGGVLEQVQAIDDSAAPHCTFTQAVQLVLSQLAGASVPEPGGEPAIELVGFLELLLDDAPRLVIAGMNEQHVPAPPRSSALLPEGVRQALALPGDERRLARDGFALVSMMGWRKGVKLIAGKRSQAGDPLMPSRLLLRADDRTLVGRVTDFVDEQTDPSLAAPTLLTPGKADRFLIPCPPLGLGPITELSVTGFRDYLACPYRFYLKRIRGLKPLDDQAIELSAPNFGTLAHDALCVLAGEDLRTVADRDAIADRLDTSLDQAFRKTYGSDPPIAAQVQREQLRHRLRAFASVQAEMVAEGWRIIYHEHELDTTFQLDGKPFTVKGKIDRIDRHEDGRVRLIDYKTSDTAKKPDKTHRQSGTDGPSWVDLQLPLYLQLAGEIQIDASAELAYINLPKKTGETRYAPADWSEAELGEAYAQRDAVIRDLRAGVFWPPNDPPRFDDGLAGVCGDAAADRGALISASSPEAASAESLCGPGGEVGDAG